MEIEKITEGKNLAYKTHNSEGTLKVGQVYKIQPGKKQGGNSWFVIGFDKVKQRDITVRPSQLSTIKRK